MAQPADLLTEIRTGALDSKVDLPTLLRKCIALGGDTGSERLRTWATRELKGYQGDEDLPRHRRLVAPLHLDAALPGGMVRHQAVPLKLIPDVARERLTGEIPFPQPIAELQDLVEGARRRGETTVELGPPGSQQLVALMNHELAKFERSQSLYGDVSPSQQIDRIYWSVSLTPIAGILDVVRTTLVELVAEMRAGTPPGQVLPTREVAEQAVDVAINGKRNRVTIIQQVADQAVASTGGSASISTSEPESRSRSVMWWLGGMAGLVSAGAAVWVIVFK